MDIITITGVIDQTTGATDLLITAPCITVFFYGLVIYLAYKFFNLALNLWK